MESDEPKEILMSKGFDGVFDERSILETSSDKPYSVLIIDENNYEYYGILKSFSKRRIGGDPNKKFSSSFSVTLYNDALFKRVLSSFGNISKISIFHPSESELPLASFENNNEFHRLIEYSFTTVPNEIFIEIV